MDSVTKTDVENENVLHRAATALESIIKLVTYLARHSKPGTVVFILMNI